MNIVRAESMFRSGTASFAESLTFPSPYRDFFQINMSTKSLINNAPDYLDWSEQHFWLLFKRVTHGEPIKISYNMLSVR
jgi:hypothetical protein